MAVGAVKINISTIKRSIEKECTWGSTISPNLQFSAHRFDSFVMFIFAGSPRDLLSRMRLHQVVEVTF